MAECLFCNLATGKIKSDLIYKDENLIVFKDINPQAPVHLLVIPVKHYANINAAAKTDPEIVSKLLAECARQGEEFGGENGFRIVVNTGKHGGQTVEHLHFHILAGRELQWPPG